MSTITYRPYEPRDAEGVLALINDAFHIHRYASRPYLERSVADVFLSDCLLGSSYAQVAVAQADDAARDNGSEGTERVVGVIMGRVEDEPRIPGRPAVVARKAASLAWLATAGLPQWDMLKQSLGYNRLDARLRQDVLGSGQAALTDEITLLAVRRASRGHGVGSRLYDGFMEHLRTHGRRDFFLLTDSLCTYEFCERRGMRRAAERNLELSVPGLPENVGVFLYAGEVPDEPNEAETPVVPVSARY